MKNLLSVRTFVYLGILIVLGVAVEMKKAEIREKRSAPVESVLSQWMEQGVPVETQEVKRDAFVDYVKTTLVACGTRRACFYESARTSRRLSVGQPVISAESDQRIGNIESVSRRAELQSGLYQVRVRLDSKVEDEKHRTAKIEVARAKGVVSVPVEAISVNDGKNYVWVVDGSNAVRKEVRLGRQNSERVEILSGLDPGESLVVNGAGLLNSFKKIRIKENAANSKLESKVSEANL